MNDFLQVYREHLPEWWPRLLDAARITAEISTFGFILALVLAAALVVMNRSRFAPLRVASNAVVEFLRAVPLLALLLALYFGLPSFGLTLSGYWAGVIGLGLQGAAYVAEVFPHPAPAAVAGRQPVGVQRIVALRGGQAQGAVLTVCRAC